MSIESRIAKILEAIDELNKDQDSITLKLDVKIRHQKNYLTLEQVMQLVCDNTGLTPEQINQSGRKEEIVIPRQICHYLAFKKSKSNLAAIGAYFGGKDHSTVLNSINKIEGRLAFDNDFKDKYGFFLNNY